MLSVLVPEALVPVLVLLGAVVVLGVDVLDIVELAGSVVVVVVVVVAPVPLVLVLVDELRLLSVDDVPDGVPLRVEPVPLVLVEVEPEVSVVLGVVPLVVPVVVPDVPVDVPEVCADAPMAHTRAAAAAARVRLEDSLVIAYLL